MIIFLFCWFLVFLYPCIKLPPSLHRPTFQRSRSTPTLPQWLPLLLCMEVASVCAAAASSSDSGGPGGATSVYRSCCSDMGSNWWEGGATVGVGERRGWTHSLLLITDQYTDWSPLILDQLNPPLLSPLAHQSALQQPWFGRGEMGGKNNDGWTCVLCLSHSLFHSVTKTGSLLHPAPHPPDSPLVRVEDYIWTAGDGGWGAKQWNYKCTSCSNKNMISLSWTTVRSPWSIISTNHMTPLCDHPVIPSALTNKQQRGERG